MTSIGDRLPFGTIILHRDRGHMSSDWEDFIFARRLASGRISIKAYKLADNNRAPSRRVWIPIHSGLNLKRHDKVVAAISQCAELLDTEIDWDDVLKAFRSIDGGYASLIERFLKDQGSW